MYGYSKLVANSSEMKSLFNKLVGLVLALSMLLPTAITPAKTILLFLIIIAGSLLLLSGKTKLSTFTISWALVYVSAGIVWSTYGLIKGNPGSVYVLSVMGVYPLVFTFLCAGYMEKDKDLLLNLFINVGAILCILNLAYILSYTLMTGSIIQLAIEELYEEEAVVDAAETYFKFTLPNISSCIFLLPFLLTHYFHSTVTKIRAGVVILAMIIIMLLSGRRGFLIALIGGLLISYLITFKPTRKDSYQIKINFNSLALCVVSVAGLGWFFSDFYGSEYYISQITSIFDFKDNSSNFERARQFEFMMDEVAQSPIFGAGAGAAAQYSRSEVQPWAYELAYVAFLFQYGIFGFLLYATGILVLIYHLVTKVRKIGRNSFEFSYLTGFISFMIANSTNPYLSKFDYMWVIFIPVALLNQRFLYGGKVNRVI